MKLFLLLITLFLTSSFADKTVIKTITINQLSYPNKTLPELKEIALQKAKLAAAKEMYGEFLISETVMVGGKILDDVVSEKSGGVIHIKGEPNFKNGENFGDLQVTIEAYATDEEIEDMTPRFIKLNDFKYTNADISPRDLKAAAESAFIVEAISPIKPSIRSATINQARKVILSVQIINADYDEQNASYIMSGAVEYVPAFLRNAEFIVEDKDTKEADNGDFLNSYQEQIQQVKRGFYGLWSGFIMYSNGASADVNIEITDSGSSTIDYNSLNCGGDLIIQDKTSTLVKFKEKLTYGKDKCEDEHFVSLKKINNTQLLFMQSDEQNREVARGTLYREE
ncbi:MAG: hypothetical protein OQK48_01885 [Sulfurimonas sp.]|uniref:hypothetical protein n=1 Tax=Sulfurimonas sp. TaxID=2022749 RepID=UPI002601825C|nr:hypothetical protein [Sulfurimonas sp.]MCW8895238.1 hypothetical protein [Sulfurimonas sp.]MCW8953672.1 hypothetical protein [Sulfurimonas sp.]MCW9067589.1 hypothetical protein [Sulfurimonas sp.]